MAINVAGGLQLPRWRTEGILGKNQTRADPRSGGNFGVGGINTAPTNVPQEVSSAPTSSTPAPQSSLGNFRGGGLQLPTWRTQGTPGVSQAPTGWTPPPTTLPGPGGFGGVESYLRNYGRFAPTSAGVNTQAPINTGPTQPPMETDTRYRSPIPPGLMSSISEGSAGTPNGLRGLFSNYGGAGGTMSNQANRNRLFY
jgi:hypothetical protein